VPSLLVDLLPQPPDAHLGEERKTDEEYPTKTVDEDNQGNQSICFPGRNT
jgi:hypothetical protein